jgi:hypothetical protein
LLYPELSSSLFCMKNRNDEDTHLCPYEESKRRRHTSLQVYVDEKIVHSVCNLEKSETFELRNVDKKGQKKTTLSVDNVGREREKAIFSG